jgi:flagellar basal body rod protein FlgG
MPYGMYISAEGAQAQQQRLEVIANNMANMETVGFKRDVPVFQARFAQAIQQQSDYPHSGSQNDVGGGVKIIDVETDFDSKSLRQTDIPTDFTVNGEGYFQVQAPDGNIYLTRAGNFNIDANGRRMDRDRPRQAAIERRPSQDGQQPLPAARACDASGRRRTRRSPRLSRAVRRQPDARDDGDD